MNWTIAKVLQWTIEDFRHRGLDSPRLDAELLVSHALKLRRIELYTKYDQPLRPEELAAIRALVERRRRHEPVAYIRGEREFYGRVFQVDGRVLIPRPETEGVIEAALAHLGSDLAEGTSVLDVGVGSGTIALTLAAERPALRVTALDASEDALALARINAEKLEVHTRVRWLKSETFEALANERFALIASNPPYIPSAEVDTLMPDVRLHEPRLALDGGADGLDVLRVLIDRAPTYLQPGGALVLEFGKGQHNDILALAEQRGYAQKSVQKDLAGIERVAVLVWEGAHAGEGGVPSAVL